jgi:hypothetical protein
MVTNHVEPGWRTILTPTVTATDQSLCSLGPKPPHLLFTLTHCSSTDIRKLVTNTDNYDHSLEQEWGHEVHDHSLEQEWGHEAHDHSLEQSGAGMGTRTFTRTSSTDPFDPASEFSSACDSVDPNIWKSLSK